MNIELVRDAFLETSRVDNFSEATIKQRNYHLSLLFTHLKKQGVADTEQIEKEHLETFIDYVQALINKQTDKPFVYSTRYSVCLTAKLFLQYCVMNEHMKKDYSALLEFEWKRKRLPDNILTESKIKKVLKAPNEHTYRGFRDKVIFELMYNTGLRRREVVNLELYDINFDEYTIFVKQGKGKKDRIVPMGEYLEKYLKEYTSKVRPVLTKSLSEVKLFVNGKGEAMRPGTLNTIMLKYSKRLGIRFNSHTFRHSFATHMLKHGAGLLYIQQILGHSDPTSTEIYTKVYPTDLKEIVVKFHPRSTKKLAEEEIKLPTKKKNTSMALYRKKILSEKKGE